jgi:putative acetyltransferase
MIIREATDGDLDDVLDVERRAFGRDDEAELVRALMADPSAEPRLSLLALSEGRAVGHILFTAVTVNGADRSVPASILAPMAIVPREQSQGYGSRLIEEGLKRLAKADVALVFVLGHPGYYPRFGFVPASPLGFAPPYPLSEEQANAWMVQAVRGGAVGELTGQVKCADALSRPELWR